MIIRVNQRINVQHSYVRRRMRRNTQQTLFRLFSFCIIICFVTVVESSNSTQANGTQDDALTTNTTHGSHEGIKVFVAKFANVSAPFGICVLMIVACLAKLIFQKLSWISNLPESCMLILLGLVFGLVMKAAGAPAYHFLNSESFFLYLLPPIMFDAGYFIKSKCFFDNIGTILLYAVVGTVINTFLVGVAMWGVSSTASVEITLLQSLLFGALISAVDPVAVLAVFEEVQVNEVLYMLVLGESILNDAVSAVLYRTFQSLSDDNIDSKQVGLAIVSFFVVSIFGVLIGVIFGLVTSFMTRFTKQMRVIEPALVLYMAYAAYLTAEAFHFSGIMSILFCGVVMKPYVKSNISRKSRITIKYFMKLLAASSEAIIFMFLGGALVHHFHIFNIRYIAWCIFFITIFRVLCIVSLTWMANMFRLVPISKIEQFIMSYGGLRGAVAFCLAIVIDEGKTKESLELKYLLVTSTLVVIIFTCFLQGATMKPLVEKLGVKKAESREHTMVEHINNKVMGYTLTGVERILGGGGNWRSAMQDFHKKVLRRYILREPGTVSDNKLIREERRLQQKHFFAHCHSVHYNEMSVYCSENKEGCTGSESCPHDNQQLLVPSGSNTEEESPLISICPDKEFTAREANNTGGGGKIEGKGDIEMAEIA